MFSLFASSHPREVDNLQNYEEIIKNSFLFEFAEYANRVSSLDNKVLYKIFNKKQLDNGKVSMKGLVQKRVKEDVKEVQRMEV